MTHTFELLDLALSQLYHMVLSLHSRFQMVYDNPVIAKTKNQSWSNLHSVIFFVIAQMYLKTARIDLEQCTVTY
jgi:hypothetical protein